MKHKAFIVSFILFTQSSFANYKDTIHHTNLATELDLRGLSVPTGNGILAHGHQILKVQMVVPGHKKGSVCIRDGNMIELLGKLFKFNLSST